VAEGAEEGTDALGDGVVDERLAQRRDPGLGLEAPARHRRRQPSPLVYQGVDGELAPESRCCTSGSGTSETSSATSSASSEK